MPHAVADVAGELRLRLPGLRVFRLHKLLYFCQGYHLAHFGSQLFDETVSAWDHGPVVGRLWHAENALVQNPGAPEIEDEGALNTIGFVASHFGHLSSRELEDLTHAQEPWQLADRDRPTGGRSTIRPEWLRDYFRRALEQDAGDGSGNSSQPGLRRPIVLVASGAEVLGKPDARSEIEARLRRYGR